MIYEESITVTIFQKIVFLPTKLKLNPVSSPPVLYPPESDESDGSLCHSLFRKGRLQVSIDESAFLLWKGYLEMAEYGG